MASESAWHPAFMPNSPAENAPLKTKDILPTLSGTNPATDNVVSSSPGAESEGVGTGITEEGTSMAEYNEPSRQEYELQTTNLSSNMLAHPELNALQDALSPLLASPGRFELADSQAHTDRNIQMMAHNEDKTDFSNEAPTPNKHSSTMSFARTVSEDVNWAEEDDEVDSNWNMRRLNTESDPFKDMAHTDRTNSFPQVPAAHAPDNMPELLHSKVEDIINDVEQKPRDFFADGEGGDDDFFRQNALRTTTAEVPYEGEIKGDYGLSYGGDKSQNSDDDLHARFEEGLPLVQSQEHEGQTPVTNHSLFADIEDDGGHDFFAQVSQPTAAISEADSHPHLLERKSTIQVMKSLSSQPYPHTHDAAPENAQLYVSQSQLDWHTGGGIASSKSTIISQVLSEIEVAPGAKVGDSEEDLAAKWKAALDGDEFLDDDDELLPDDDEPTAKNPLDPSELFGSDDEGFLDDGDGFLDHLEPSQAAPVTGANGQRVDFDAHTGLALNNRPGSSSSSSRYLPSAAQSQPVIPQHSNLYATVAPAFTDLLGPSTSILGQNSAFPSVVAAFPSHHSQQQRPEIPKAESFADKSKGGYSSPYDLPMEVVKPRKRPSMLQMKTAASAVAPPRSSSMNTPTTLPPPPRGATASLPPHVSPQASQSVQQGQQTLATIPTQQNPPTLKTKASFFEELPMASRPKVSPRYSSGHDSQVSSAFTPSTAPPSLTHLLPQTTYTPSQELQHQVSNPAHGLVAPERVSPYAQLPSTNMVVPPTASRYSPAPPPQQGQNTVPPPVAQSRYSPAPLSRQPPHGSLPVSQPPLLPHQPRTSSPLAQFSQGQHGSNLRRGSSSYESSLKPQSLPPTHELDEGDGGGSSQHTAAYIPTRTVPSQTPPPPQFLGSPMLNSPPKRNTSNYQPQSTDTSPPRTIIPPRRSQTHSPSVAHASSRMGITTAEIYQRPASVETPASPPPAHTLSSIPTGAPNRPRGFSQGVNYITPTDGREQDPMQRWRGAPVFVWGVGGTLITSFPNDVPRYNGSMAQMIRSPGEVKIRNVKDIDPLPVRLTSFPGPLKGKSKKKDVVSWLSAGIDILEQNAAYLRGLSALSHEDKRTEERILLWKILRVFIDNDGTLEGSAIVDKAVRAVLSPNLIDEQSSAAAPLYATGADLSGISHSALTGTREDPIDLAAVDQLRKHLLRGDREKAVWDAVDNRLWAHAMLISNTVSPTLYKNVCQEFVTKEVRTIGENTESLAALYEIFAGNLEESIDELVPPSARAGFQLVSTSGSGSSAKDALDGLDRWRETLGLVLSNRSANDNQALTALGKLLSGYGRAEAAHICFLFARKHSVFGGIDDPTSSMVLVGSDHHRQPFEFDKEMEPILLSEVFEYGTALASNFSPTLSSPHLSIYKLQHAKLLAEYGYREKALEYCETIGSSMHSQTRKSLYHHALLSAEVDDLTKRLKQSPKDSKSSWISKPSVDKVSNTVWSKFTSFVAGDDNEDENFGSTANIESGPFARIGGSTPTISRSPSSADIYGSYNGGVNINGALGQSGKVNRYAPGATYYPAGPDPQLGTSYQSNGSQPRTSLEGRSSGEYKRNAYEPVRRGSDYLPPSQSVSGPNHYTPQGGLNLANQSSYSPHGNGFSFGEPVASYSLQYSDQVAESTVVAPGPSPRVTSSKTQPIPISNLQQSSFGSFQSSGYEVSSSLSQEPLSSSGYEPPTSNYQPYDPPSYEPALMSEPDSSLETQPKKKSFMEDDDEYDFKPVSATGEKTKAEKDREVDEAFRKAAEADGEFIFYSEAAG
ncbi:Sec23-binding domain of Sec16-domain-containing protein [Bisporella sp. PMI_857]|nr:Sec23-binding domain of Sec16-domain-containing protein [Bisporella sp. PMI_857]